MHTFHPFSWTRLGRSRWWRVGLQCLICLSLVACSRRRTLLPTLGPTPTPAPASVATATLARPTDAPSVSASPTAGATESLVPLPTATLAPTTSVAPVPAFGMLAVVPDASRSTSDVGAIEAVAGTGARYIRIALEWAIAEPSAGQLSFSTKNDSVIADVESAGLRLFPTLYVGRGWMNGNPPSAQDGGSRSFPPNDLGMSWSDSYGYSQSYYDFVYQFISHYQGHFDYVAIENEANSKLFWGGTVEEYVRLLQTAYLAIHAADPNVKVVDSGMVSGTWGLCAAADYIDSGQMSREAALQLALDYYSAETATTGRFNSTTQIEQALSQERVQEQCRRYEYILDHAGGAVDAINFHFYEDYRALHIVTDWIRSRMTAAGYSAGLVTHELGQRGPDTTYAEGAGQAISVFKKLVTGASLGLEVMIWFSADTINTDAPSPDKVGLFNSDGGARPAAQTYKHVAETLGAGYHLSKAVAVGPALYHYVFVNTAGNSILEALWVEGAGQVVALSAPSGYTTASVIDYLGQIQPTTADNGQITLTLSDAPVWVVWQ